MFGKALKATLGVGVGCVVLIIGLAIIGGLATTTKPSGTLTPAAAATATAAGATSAVTQAAAKQWVVVKQWSGSGIKDTEQFTVGGEWRVDWDYSPGQFGGVFQIYVYSGSGQLVDIVANTQKAGPDSSFQHKAGTYYLKINATGDWKVAVQDRR